MKLGRVWRWRDPVEGFAPRLWPVWIVVPLWLVGAGITASLLNSFLRDREDLVGENPDPLDVTRVVVTLLAAVGAVFAGVYAYRKQRIEESSSRRADAQAFMERYNSAAEQLGSSNVSVRMAGVFALAHLADDWIAQRQQCVDVLCGYLRLPFNPSDASRAEAELRRSIMSIIRTRVHNRAKGRAVWWDVHFDLRGAYLDDFVLRDAVINGSLVLDGARFAGRETFIVVEAAQDAVLSLSHTVFEAEETLVSLRKQHFDGEIRMNGSAFLGPSSVDVIASYIHLHSFRVAGEMSLSLSKHYNPNWEVGTPPGEATCRLQGLSVEAPVTMYLTGVRLEIDEVRFKRPGEILTIDPEVFKRYPPLGFKLSPGQESATAYADEPPTDSGSRTGRDQPPG